VSTGGAPRAAVQRVYLSTTLWMVAYAFVIVALPFRFMALGLSVFAYGTVLAVYAVGMLATEGVWGSLAFRLGDPRVVFGLGAALSLTYLTLGLVGSYPALLLTLLAFGILVVFPVPFCRWLSLTARGPGQEATGTGRYGLFVGAGLVVGASLGPLLYVVLGYLYLAVVAAGISVVATTVFATIRWDELPIPPSTGGARRELRDLLHRPFLAVAGLVATYYLCFCLTTNFLQYYSVSLFGGTPTESGFAIGAARAVTVVAGFVLGPSVDRWSPARSAPLGFALLAVGALGTFAAVTYPEMIAATLVFSVGAGCLAAALLPLALARVPSRAQGTAVGVFGSFEDLGLFLGPLVIGGIYAMYGARSIFPAAGAIALIGGALAAAVPRWTSLRGETRVADTPERT
jgi:MFS family permease